MTSIHFNHRLDVISATDAIRGRRFGVIETSGGDLVAIHFRWLPKLVSWPEWWPVGPAYHASGQPDHCLLYYNQPWGHANFLALKYIVSTPDTSYATFRAALVALDGVAEIKKTDALLCDAFNRRISDRLLHRLGWEPHAPSRWHRNYIKRFYGSYPDAPALGLSANTANASTELTELAL